MIAINLENKVALVTGAGKGIGKAIALKLGEAGCDIALNYFQSEAGAEETCSIIKSMGRKSMTIKADIKDYSQVKKMVAEVVTKLRTVDFLINNTGITSVKKIDEIDEAEWHRILETNLTGAFYCSKECAVIMKKNKSGRIVNISSAAAYTGRGGGAHYASTKGGMNAFTLALARELASYGILVNGIAPAVIESDFLYTRYPTKKDREKLAENIPIGRIGTGEDIANIVLFLCSPLSNYISGETILADGGRTFTGS